MRRQIDINEISIMNRAVPCFNNCKYCLAGNQKLSTVSFDRFSSIVERFMAWRDRYRPEMKMICSMLYSMENDIETQSKFMKLRDRLQRPARYLLFGGLKRRSEAEMRDWLKQRQDLGMDSAIVSFAGMDEVHDYWTGCKGDFAFMMSALKVAGELGMNLTERLFLARNTLQHVEKLIAYLDAIPGKVVGRSAIPFLYRGRGVQQEEQRITEEIRDSLPERVKQLASWGLGVWEEWLSEREWIEVIRRQDNKPREVRLHIDLNESTVDRFERIDPGDIIAGMEDRTRSAYAAIPPIGELCELNADPTNRRIYTNRDDVERLWLKRHLEKYPLSFDRQFTHL